LRFRPTTCAIPSPQSPQLSDRPADRDGFDGADLANDLEVHCANLACGLNDLDVTPLPKRQRSAAGVAGPLKRSVGQPFITQGLGPLAPTATVGS